MIWVCKEFGLDPAEYFLETDPEKNMVRDAAATVLYDEARKQQQQMKQQQ